MTRRILFLCTLFMLACAPSPYAAPGMNPGFRTLGIWESETSTRLDLAVWYPAGRSPSRVDYGDWSFTVSRGATPLPGPYPLIMLSHDSAGSRFSLHLLAAELARNGFVVVAPTHSGDNVDDMSAFFSLANVTQRAQQLSLTLDLVLRHAELAPLIDPQRVGVLGIGPGGTAALLLAGARLDGSSWNAYAEEHTATNDPYCSPWAKSRMNQFAATANPKESFRDRRIRTVIAVSPTSTMLFTAASLSRIRIPLLFLRAEKAPLYTQSHAERLLRAMPQPPRLGILPDADTASLMSPCGETLSQTLPEMCLSDEALRESVQQQLARAASAFFTEQLTTPELPPLPPEPEESPVMPEVQTKKIQPEKKRH